MLGLKIRDSRKTKSGGNALSIDLRDILGVIGEPARKARWRCRNLYCTANRDGEFIAIRQDRCDFSGEELFQFASDIWQTIDGRFEVRREGAAKKSWLIIVAFDSSWFEVWSSKQKITAKLEDHFEKTEILFEKLRI